MAEPRPGSCSRILEAYGESNNNLPGNKDSLKKPFLPHIKTAMVINGEFLVSVSLGMGGGTAGKGKASDRQWFSEGPE